MESAFNAGAPGVVRSKSALCPGGRWPPACGGSTNAVILVAKIGRNSTTLAPMSQASEDLGTDSATVAGKAALGALPMELVGRTSLHSGKTELAKDVML